MFSLKLISGGREVSLDQFMERIKREAIESAMERISDIAHGKAASLVDPATGKHPVVIVRWLADNRLIVRTSGSDEYARMLENRLDLTRGSVTPMDQAPGKKRLVYFAHASEDKAIARSIAEGLMGRGIETWFDQWEIATGDSLRQKMEQGLENCTHFVVLLTANSIGKPWVNQEIDAGFAASVEGTAKFMGLRLDLPLGALTPFLRARRCPEIAATEQDIENLAGDILGVSRRPPLGSDPRYVRQDPISVSGWSAAAVAVAENMVKASEHAFKFDPQVTYHSLQADTGLPMADVRLGVLDLVDARLVEKGKEFGGQLLYALPALFTEFDAIFMGWNPKDDAKTVAMLMHNLNIDRTTTERIGTDLEWNPRRLNPAMNFLVEAKVISGSDALGGNYRPTFVSCGDSLLRYVRSFG